MPDPTHRFANFQNRLFVAPRVKNPAFIAVSPAVFASLGGATPVHLAILREAYLRAQAVANRPYRWQAARWCGAN
jgi:hypothetical protein